MKLYKCIEDRQGGTWCVDYVHPARYGKELALEWCASDGNDGVFDYLEKLEDEEKIIKFIDDFGDITLVEENVKK